MGADREKIVRYGGRHYLKSAKLHNLVLDLGPDKISDEGEELAAEMIEDAVTALVKYKTSGKSTRESGE